ncbi:MAG TPA: AMP-binding protein [Pyrinomonadaceae bacterium]|nr:AMP-binding protein [Pyrinomonadaceae bacterium]
MLSEFIEVFEGVALRTNPELAMRLLGALPASAIAVMQKARFRRTLRLADERSPFYREQFRQRGIDVRRITHPSQLGDFYTTGEDLRTSGAEQFLTGHADTAFETTGTTSPAPKTVFFSRDEVATMGRITAMWLYLLGLRREDRVLSAFDCSFWVSPWVLRSGLEYLKCFHVEAGKIDPHDFYERAKSYRPTVIFGEPSWMVRLSEIASERGVWPLKFLFAGGENIAEAARSVVERAWSAPLYLNYGQTESFGALGAECKLKDGYHRNDLYFFFELDNVGEDGYGEVIYTTLARDVMPLIRYRSTDVTRLVDEPCDCGIFAGRLAKIRGRCDEMVVCGMGNVGPWVFAEILRGVEGVEDEWQVVVKQEKQHDILELRFETSAAASSSPIIERAILVNLRDRFSDFWKNYEMKMYDLRIVPCASGSLRNGRKLQRVVDKREMLK